MKIALISDVHANFPALESVLKDAQTRGIQAIWNLGDLLGYGPYPNEVVEGVKKEGAQSIIGNYDEKVLGYREKKRNKKPTDPAKLFSFEWTAKMISPATRSYLKQLPAQRRLNVSGKSFLLVHGSPFASDEPLTLETPGPRFLEIAQQARADYILCGHSHHPFHKKTGKVVYVNPGSVGRSFDGNPAASYAILSFEKGDVQITHHRVGYDLKTVISKMEQLDFPERLIRSIQEGKSLDSLGNELSLSGDPKLRRPASSPSPRASTEQKDKVIKQIIGFAQKCHYEPEHSKHVTGLALKVFDQLKDLHQAGEKERLWLQSAALLHDIGWQFGRQAHHKVARDIILNAADFPFPKPEKILIALIARYHRQSCPQDNHKYYSDLDSQQKLMVRRLAALLRIADGLDRSQQGLVKDVRCQLSPQDCRIRLTAQVDITSEISAAQAKADLFEDVFKMKVVFAADENSACENS